MARSNCKKCCRSLSGTSSCKNIIRHKEHGYRRPGGFSGHTIMNSNQTGEMECLCHRNLKSSIFIEIIKHYYRVPSSTSVSFYFHRYSRKTHYGQTQRNKTSYLRLRGSYLSAYLCAGCRSGQSSPQPSIASLIFSSASKSSHSPPSSQTSTTDLPDSPPISPTRPQPRIQVASLLVDPFSSARSYELEVVQHPLRTAEFGMANLSRLPLTPPIIARLTVKDSSGNSIVPEAELPFLIAHLSLFSGDGSTSLDMGSCIGRAQSQSPPILYGNLVSVVEQLEDLQGNMGLFFLFPDVSIRWRGRYQLGVTLSRISNADPSRLANGTLLTQARTRAFDAMALHQYRAAPQTRLTQSFLRQGARMFLNMPYSES